MALLYGPLSDCPRCRAVKCYGRCFVGSENLLFACDRCGHHDSKPLPSLRKKIIYIDQFALSKMVKQADDPFWSDLKSLLGQLVANQLITCPYSPIHIEESLFAPDLRNPLKEMYRSIAGDDEFERIFEIQKQQLSKQLKTFLGEPQPDENDLEMRSGCKRNPHRWSDVGHVHIDFPVNEEFVKRLRKARDGFFTSMNEVCDHWRRTPQSFEEDAAMEFRTFGKGLTAEYRAVTGGNPDRFHYGTPPHLDVMDWLVQWVVALKKEERDPVGVVEQFFHSKECAETPFLKLWSRLWAAIAEMVRNPSGSRKPQRGDFYDAKVVAYYAPYCDAMFIDKGYRAISEDPRVNIKGQFGTHVFSEQNRDDFIALLHEIRSSMTDQHRTTLSLVYPIDYSGNACCDI